MTRLKCDGRYDTILGANSLLSPTVKEHFLNRPTFLKVMNEYQVALFMAHDVETRKWVVKYVLR